MKAGRAKEQVRKLVARRDDRVLSAIIDAVPNPMFLADDEARVQALNRAAAQMVRGEGRTLQRPLCGDVLRCATARDARDGCGTAKSCAVCVVRSAIERACRGHAVRREYTHMRLWSGDHVKVRHFLVTAVPYRHDGARLALLTLEDITDVLLLYEKK